MYSGNDYSAKEEVNALIRSLGFTPVDRGSLSNAIEIEDIPVQRFPQWKAPSIVSLIVFIFLFLLIFLPMLIFQLLIHLCHSIEDQAVKNPKKLPSIISLNSLP